MLLYIGEYEYNNIMYNTESILPCIYATIYIYLYTYLSILIVINPMYYSLKFHKVYNLHCIKHQYINETP